MDYKIKSNEYRKKLFEYKQNPTNELKEIVVKLYNELNEILKDIPFSNINCRTGNYKKDLEYGKN
jgi:hypothetical protein